MNTETLERSHVSGPSAVERRVGPWPAAVGRASSDGWQIDPELLVRIKRDISTNEETRYGLDMEQIETVMLALVRMGLAPNVSRHCTCHPDDNPPQPCEHRYAFRDCADAAEERYLRETLAMLQESYAKAAKPYLDRLVALHSRSLPPMLVPVEQAQALGLLPANASFSREPELSGGESAGSDS